MAKSIKLPIAEGSVFLVIELQEFRSGTKQGIAAVLSIPGRDNTFRRFWTAPGGRLDAAQADDLCAWVAKASSDSLLAWTGVQGTLSL